MKHFTFVFFTILTIIACKKVENKTNPTDTKIKDTMLVEAKEIPNIKTWRELKQELTAKGFKTYNHVDEVTKDTILMQQYFMVFFKKGMVRPQNEEEAEILQQEHIAYLKKMQALGYVDISGPLADQSAIRSISIYNVPTFKKAGSLAKLDPLVKTGQVTVEIHPWWVAKAAALR